MFFFVFKNGLVHFQTLINVVMNATYFRSGSADLVLHERSELPVKSKPHFVKSGSAQPSIEGSGCGGSGQGGISLEKESANSTVRILWTFYSGNFAGCERIFIHVSSVLSRHVIVGSSVNQSAY